jgi:hypothetical protein
LRLSLTVRRKRTKSDGSAGTFLIGSAGLLSLYSSVYLTLNRASFHHRLQRYSLQR